MKAERSAFNVVLAVIVSNKLSQFLIMFCLPALALTFGPLTDLCAEVCLDNSPSMTAEHVKHLSGNLITFLPKLVSLETTRPPG